MTVHDYCIKLVKELIATTPSATSTPDKHVKISLEGTFSNRRMDQWIAYAS